MIKEGSIYIPSEQGNQNLKELIIDLLSKDYPLSIQKIHNLLKKNFALSISYQAVHKTVKKLVERGVLEGKAREYKINTEWLELLQQYIESIQHRYTGSKDTIIEGPKTLKKDGDTQTLYFQHIADVERFRKGLQKEYFLRAQPKPAYVSQSWHMRSPIIYIERTFHLMNKIKKTKTSCYIITQGNTTIDKWCKKFYSQDYVHIKLGVPLQNESETYVFGDVILQIFIPKKTRDFLDDSYSAAGSIKNIDIQALHKKFYHQKTDVRAVLMKNNEIAKQIRARILDQFRLPIRASLFAMGKTLSSSILSEEFTKHLLKKRFVKKKEAEKSLKIFANLKKKNQDHRRTHTKIIEVIAEMLKGKSVFKTKILARECIPHNIKFFKFSQDLVDLANRWGSTFLITGAPEILIEPLAQQFGFTKTYCSLLETKDGFFTGKVKLNLSKDKGKKDIVNRLKKEHQFDVKNCFAFGDSLEDIPLFELAKNSSIIGKPGKQLEKLAKEKGWHIFPPKQEILKKIIELMNQ
tara:strand:+ start:536 stop:2098 length:1563 start_codon:yes stop_codon:yes gene_type:complete